MSRDGVAAVVGVVVAVVLLVALGLWVKARVDANNRAIDRCVAAGGYPVVGGSGGRLKACYFGEARP